MLKSVLFASAAATLALCASAQAMPLSSGIAGASSPSVTLVGGGCGVGWHPTPVGCPPQRRARRGCARAGGCRCAAAVLAGSGLAVL